MDCFRKAKPKKIRQIVRRRHDGLEFESGYNNAHWLQMVALFFSLSLKKIKLTNIILKKKKHCRCAEPPLVRSALAAAAVLDKKSGNGSEERRIPCGRHQ